MAKTTIPPVPEPIEMSDGTGFNILVQDSLPEGMEDLSAPKGIPMIPLGAPAKKKADPAPVEEDSEEQEDVDNEVAPPVAPPKKVEKKKTPDPVVAEEEAEEDGEAPKETYRAFAEFLHDKNIIDYDPKDFEDSEAGLAGVVQKTIEKEINSYKTALGKDSQKFIEYLENGGDPLKYIQAKASLNYLKVDEKVLSENDTMQKSVISDLLARDGYEEAEINDKLADYEAAGILEKEAQRSLKRLKVTQQKEDDSLITNQKAARQAQVDAYEIYIHQLETNLSKKTEIAGFPINDRDKTKLFEYMTKPVDEQGRSQLIIDTSSDPEMQMNLAWAAYKKFNFSNIERKAVTEASSKLRNALGRFTDTRQKLASSVQSAEDDSDKTDMTIFKRNLGMV